MNAALRRREREFTALGARCISGTPGAWNFVLKPLQLQGIECRVALAGSVVITGLQQAGKPQGRSVR